MQIARLTLNGINLDIDPVDLPPDVWSGSENMGPRPNGMERAPGYVEVYEPPLFAPYFLLYSPQITVPHWIYAGLNNVAVIDEAGAHTDITPTPAPQPIAANGWTGGNLNGIACINSIANPPYFWHDGLGGAAQALPGQRSASTRYRILRPFKYHLIGLGVITATTDLPDELHWSDAADPGQVPATWVPGPDNEAGDNVLSDENGAIIDGLALRDAFYIYKEDSVYEMTYVGGSSVFRFRKVFGTTGVLAANCIVRVGGSHVVLGNGDIYQHDGQNMKSIVDARVKEAFFAGIDNTAYATSFVCYNEPRNEVWFCVPAEGATAPNVAMVWNVTTDEIGYTVIPTADYGAPGIVTDDGSGIAVDDWDTDTQSWADDITVWNGKEFSAVEDVILLADAVNSKLYLTNTGTTKNGQGYSSGVTRLGLDLGSPGREKGIRRIWPKINAPADTVFNLRLFNQRSPAADQSQIVNRSFTNGPDGVAVNGNARYMGIEISTQESVAWDISGFDVEFSDQGHF